MRYIPGAQASGRRRGMVLLVVMAMLALFATVALSFVFYADAEAEAARLARQAQTKDQPWIDPEMLAGYFLNQLIYDTDNVYSAMRGWSFARSIYGNNPGALNAIPYNGVGRSALSGPDAVLGVDFFNEINYQKFYDPDPTKAGDPTLNFDRMPEFYGRANLIMNASNARPIAITSVNPHGLATGDQVVISGVEGNTAANGVFTITNVNANKFSLNGSQGNGSYTSGGGLYNLRAYRGANPPWTAYDTNSLFLAQVNADGKVVMPSFYRPWITFGANLKAAKYTSLFPHTSWHPNFVLPDSDSSGDVKNLEFGPGTNDSKWMDLGFPVMTAPNGKRYKVLFAPLIVDLNNRLNLWAHGNRIGSNQSNASNMGIGPSEVNPSRVLNQNVSDTAAIKMQKATELQALFNFKYGGLTGTALAAPLNAPIGFGRAGPWYGKVDFDALSPSGNSSGHLVVPFMTTSTTGSITAGPAKTIGVTATGTTAGGFPWAFFDVVVPGTKLVVDTGVLTETVTVSAVNAKLSTFTADFAKAHPNAITPVFFNATFPYPAYPAGWDNLTGEQVVGKPLGFNIQYNPGTWGATGTYALNTIVFYAPDGLFYKSLMAGNLNNIPPKTLGTWWTLASDVEIGAGTQKGPQISIQEALMRFGGTNSPALTSEVFRRMPLTFSDIRARNMVTMWSTHFDRISAAPYISYNPTTAGHYLYNAGLGYPKGGAAPPPPGSTAKLPANSEYDTKGWRSTLGQMLRVNLNRTLTNYPATVGGLITNAAVYNQALWDRQKFAKDIYSALIRVTGAQDPNAVMVASTTADYQAARWLAQIAVNIVDYIDDDDYMTPFNWYPGATPATDGWVFGTEQPRLVLNEAYAQYDNDGSDASIYVTPQTALQTAAKASQYKLNSWIELLNPLQTTALGGTSFPNDQGMALLQNTVFPVYQVLVCRSSAALTTAMRDPANNTGAPTAASMLGINDIWGTTALTQRVLPANGAFSGAITSRIIDAATATLPGASWKNNIVTIHTTAAHPFTTGQRVQIAGVSDPGYNGTFNITRVNATTFKYFNGIGPLTNSGGGTASLGSNTGFYVLGPNTAAIDSPMFIQGRDAGLVTTFASPKMSIQQATTDTRVTNATYLLRRLAVPHLPPQNNPALPLFNPYITVDYLDNIPVNDGRVYNATGVKAVPPAAVTSFKSSGRSQPYAAHFSQVAPQTIAQPGQPFNTFFTHNSNAAMPFTWLTHLDRPLVNQLELLHVSGYKPHELTQQFITTAGPFKHYAPWTDTNALIYRALEVLGTPNHMAGTFSGGRWPGNINLNTVTEEAVLQALADAQDGQAKPLFTSNDVKLLFNTIVTARSTPAGEGTPFQPFASDDIKNTWLRPAGTQRLFDVGDPTAHTYAKMALLQKIFNNITTTSNVFGVWWTAGYFEVVNESVRPAQLGKEIGRDEGRNVRHRFFAIVDRSGLQLFNTTAVKDNFTMVATVTVGGIWNFATTYDVGDRVTYQGGYYKSIQTSNKGNLPTDTNFWIKESTPVGGVETLRMFFNPAPATGKANAVAYTLQAGMLLEIGSGGGGELVKVLSVLPRDDPTNPLSYPSFTAAFTKSHGAGTVIVYRGNPGPRPAYNPRRDSSVVMHMSVIE
jgi:hypothetical protein